MPFHVAFALKEMHRMTTAQKTDRHQVRLVGAFPLIVAFAVAPAFATTLGTSTVSGVHGGDSNTQGIHGGDSNTDGIHGGDSNTDGIHGGDSNTDGIHGGDSNTDGIHGGDSNVQGIHGGDSNTEGIHGGDSQTQIFDSVAMGPVERLEDSELSVLGQTFLDGGSGADVVVGDYVLAAGSDGELQILIPMGTQYVPGASPVMIRGYVSGVDASVAVLTVGGVTLDYSPQLSIAPTFSPTVGSPIEFSGTQPLPGGSVLLGIHGGDSSVQGIHGGDSNVQGIHGGDSSVQGIHGGDSSVFGIHGGDSNTQGIHGGDSNTQGIHGGDSNTQGIHGGDAD